MQTDKAVQKDKIDLDQKGNLIIPLRSNLPGIVRLNLIRDSADYQGRNLFFLFLHIFCRSFGKMFLIIPFFLSDIGLVSGLICFAVASLLFFVKIEALVKTAQAVHTFSLTEMTGRAFGVVGASFFLFMEFTGILSDYFLMIIQIDVIFIFYIDASIYLRVCVKVVQNLLFNLVLFLSPRTQNRIDKFIEIYWLLFTSIFLFKVTDLKKNDQAKSSLSYWNFTTENTIMVFTAIFSMQRDNQQILSTFGNNVQGFRKQSRVIAVSVMAVIVTYAYIYGFSFKIRQNQLGYNKVENVKDQEYQFIEMGDIFTYILPFYAISLFFMINTCANNARIMLTYFLSEKYSEKNWVKFTIYFQLSCIINCGAWPLQKGIIIILVIQSTLLFIIFPLVQNEHLLPETRINKRMIFSTLLGITLFYFIFSVINISKIIYSNTFD